jgi:hypothetical protein
VEISGPIQAAPSLSQPEHDAIRHLASRAARLVQVDAENSAYCVEGEAERADVNEVRATPIDLQRGRVDQQIQFCRIAHPSSCAAERALPDAVISIAERFVSFYSISKRSLNRCGADS